MDPDAHRARPPAQRTDLTGQVKDHEAEKRRQQRAIGGSSTTAAGGSSTGGAPAPTPPSDSDSGDDITAISVDITIPTAGLWTYRWRAQADFTDEPFNFRIEGYDGDMDSTNGAGAAVTAYLRGSDTAEWNAGTVLHAELHGSYSTAPTGISLEIKAYFIRPLL